MTSKHVRIKSCLSKSRPPLFMPIHLTWQTQRTHLCSSGVSSGNEPGHHGPFDPFGPKGSDMIYNQMTVSSPMRVHCKSRTDDRVVPWTTLEGSGKSVGWGFKAYHIGHQWINFTNPGVKFILVVWQADLINICTVNEYEATRWGATQHCLRSLYQY